MNSFYVNLKAELAEAKEELWAQTQIDGAEAGRKTLLKGEPKNTDSVFTNESGERIFQERISRPAKLVICGAAFAISGNLQKISSYIFLVTPTNVDISGDLQDLLSGSMETPSVRGRY